MGCLYNFEELYKQEVASKKEINFKKRWQKTGEPETNCR